MDTQPNHARLSRFISDYGILAVLLLLCAFFSVVTLAEQRPTGVIGGERLARDIVAQFGSQTHVLIAARSNQEDAAFADTLRDRLTQAGCVVIATVKGQPPDAKRTISDAVDAGSRLDVIAVNRETATWSLFEDLATKFPSLADVKLVQPRGYWWPNFLKASNLRNIPDQISVIAILAVGMTLVIITGGIDLSVGSLVALSAVVATWLMRDYGGGTKASTTSMTVCCLGAIVVCAMAGVFSGVMISRFNTPPFIVTLSMMLVAGGWAKMIAKNESIHQVPDSFVWLGRGVAFGGIPNGVVLMLALYGCAHVLMTRMALGRHIYAVGGNIEAARLSGVRVNLVLLFVYTACGSLAGLGGIVLASQLKSGSPNYGLHYELLTIAAVVVGGTSLSGGDGKILGTLIGALIIAVIQNGMNLNDVDSNRQDVIFGLVILGAVLLDQLKRRGWRLRP